jgi:hypothetical protein
VTLGWNSCFKVYFSSKQWKAQQTHVIMNSVKMDQANTEVKRGLIHVNMSLKTYH